METETKTSYIFLLTCEKPFTHRRTCKKKSRDPESRLKWNSGLASFYIYVCIPYEDDGNIALWWFLGLIMMVEFFRRESLKARAATRFLIVAFLFYFISLCSNRYNDSQMLSSTQEFLEHCAKYIHIRREMELGILLNNVIVIWWE